MGGLVRMNKCDHDVVRRSPESSGHRGVPCTVHQDAVQFKDIAPAEIPPSQFTDPFHRVMVVEDHALATGPRPAAPANHLSGHAPGRRCSLQLAGTDCFLHDGIGEQVLPAVPLHEVANLGLGTRHSKLLVDLTKTLPNRCGVDDGEGTPVLAPEGHDLPCGKAGQSCAQPPFLVGQALRGLPVTHVVPVEVSADHQHRSSANDLGEPLWGCPAEQGTEVGCPPYPRNNSSSSSVLSRAGASAPSSSRSANSRLCRCSSTICSSMVPLATSR